MQGLRIEKNLKMKRTKLLPLVSSIMLLSTAIFVSNSKIEQTKAYNSTLNITNTRKIDYNFGSETTPEGLNVSVTSSTKTSTGQSFSFQFSTGGQGFGDTTDTFLIAPDDENFDSFYTDFSSKSIEERKEIQEQYKNGEYETVEFDAYIYSISGREQYKDIVIPRGLKRDVFFQLNINAIGPKAISSWEFVDSITIPKEVEIISSNSFVNVPNNVVFKVEYQPSEIPSTWAADWAHGATIQYGVSIASKKEYPLSKAGASMYGDPEKNFIIGWYPKDGEQLPLVAEYKTKSGETISETKYVEFSLSSKANFYDSVGQEIIGFKTGLDLDIPTNENEEVVFESVKLHNIFPVTRDANNKIVPDTTKPYVSVPQKLFSNCYDISDFITFNFTKLASFSNYTCVDLNLKIAKDKNVYQLLKPNYYKSHKAAIDSDKEYIRYRITSLTICSFKVIYQKGNELVETIVPVKTPVTQFILNNSNAEANRNNKLAFLLKNSEISNDSKFKAADIKALSFESFFITIDIFGEKGPIARSNTTTRFGYLSIMPYTEETKLFNANNFVTLFVVLYTIIYAAGTVGLFFYTKNKFKNDEFRRLKPKLFLKKAAFGLAGSLIVILLVIFTSLRNTMFNNAIVVFNPIDAFIIITGVLSVIIVGYFIKYLVVTGKTLKERKRIIKLRLNESEADDGTK